MTETVRITIISDLQGNVLAADLTDETAKPEEQDSPRGKLIPLEGQHAISVEVPKEVLSLTGPELHLYFSGFSIQWPSEVQVPKFNVIKEDKK